MSQLTLYLGFVAAVAVIVAISHVIWQRQVKSLPAPPHWVEAWRLIWCDTYGMSWESSPRIVWVRGQTFRCSTGAMVYGESDGGAITVAVETDTTPVSATALAHEGWHCALRLKGLNPDAGHLSAAWLPMGMVDVANRRCRERGW
jgi:hypothetical protein